MSPLEFNKNRYGICDFMHSLNEVKFSTEHVTVEPSRPFLKHRFSSLFYFHSNVTAFRLIELDTTASKSAIQSYECDEECTENLLKECE